MVAPSFAAGSGEIPFRRTAIDLGSSETCAIADVNQDGRLDIISGENWYQQVPAWRPGESVTWIPHHFRELPYTNFYYDNFTDLAVDINGDGYPDLVSASFFSKQLAWYENPAGQDRPWSRHIIESKYPVEFVFLVDLLNAGKPLQLLPEFGDLAAPLTWYELVGTGSGSHWQPHQVSSQSFGHGIGVGDINGDGRNDIITPKGWFEAPADPRNGTWIWHPDFDLGVTSFIYVDDVNGDGLPDLVTGAAHDYGVFWYEQKVDSVKGRTWTKHLIDDTWSQAHALGLVDFFHDGRRELVTGKRYLAHNGHDPGGREPLGLYWYEHVVIEGRLEWVRHIIDYGSRVGAGMQICAADIEGHGNLDIVVGGKSGLFLFENLAPRAGPSPSHKASKGHESSE